MITNVIQPLVLKSLDASTLNLIAWFRFDAIGLTHPCNIIRITNASYIPINISFDAVSISDIMLARTDLTYNFQSNSLLSGKVAMMKKGSFIYINGNGAPKAGYVYLSGYYNKEF